MRIRKQRQGYPRRAGLTLIEITLVATVAAVVVFRTAIALGGATREIGTQANQTQVEERVRIVLDRIAYQLMGADRESLTPLNTVGMHVSGVRYRVSLGVDNGEVVYSEEEEVRYVDDDEADEVTWTEHVGTTDERRLVWTRLVQPLLEGEQPNGIDDNENGLVDEEGLFFIIEGDHIEIGLTLARVEKDGRRSQFTATRFVKLRN